MPIDELLKSWTAAAAAAEDRSEDEDSVQDAVQGLQVRSGLVAGFEKPPETVYPYCPGEA